jgi:hypothetical protein
MEPVYISDKRYDHISAMIRKSYPDACVLFIDEVNNTFLEEEHSKLAGKVKKQLFHGTHEKNINSIARNGFDCSLNVRSAYGKGTYFSEHANYSIHYATSNNDIVYMFLCDVIVDSPYTTVVGNGIHVVNHNYVGIPKYVIAFYPKAKN